MTDRERDRHNHALAVESSRQRGEELRKVTTQRDKLQDALAAALPYLRYVNEREGCECTLKRAEAALANVK